MNINGIKFLRNLRLPGPRKETIFTDISSVDLENLYQGAHRGATLMAFDSSEKVNQYQFLEKDIHRYEISRQDYFKTLQELVQVMSAKGVPRESMAFLTHQTYRPEDIAYSGRVEIHTMENAHSDFIGVLGYVGGFLIIDAMESLRISGTDFDASFQYQCPFIQGRPHRTQEKIIKNKFILPKNVLNKIIKDTYRIPGHPVIDFEVYADNNKIFYHDLFLTHDLILKE